MVGNVVAWDVRVLMWVNDEPVADENNIGGNMHGNGAGANLMRFRDVLLRVPLQVLVVSSHMTSLLGCFIEIVVIEYIILEYK